MQGYNFDVALKYLQSGDPDAVDQVLNQMIDGLDYPKVLDSDATDQVFNRNLNEKLTDKQKAQVLKCLKEKLLFSKEPITQREAIKAVVRDYTEVLEKPEGIELVKKAIESYNKKKKEKATENGRIYYKESYLIKDKKGKWCIKFNNTSIKKEKKLKGNIGSSLDDK